MLLFFVLSGEFCVCRLCRRSEVPLQKAGLSYSTGLEALAGTPFSIPLPSLAWHFAKAPAASCARWIWGEGGCAFKGRPGSMRKIFGEAIADIDGGYAGRRYNARRFYYQTFAENGRSEPCEAALMPSQAPGDFCALMERTLNSSASPGTGQPAASHGFEIFSSLQAGESAIPHRKPILTL